MGWGWLTGTLMGPGTGRRREGTGGGRGIGGVDEGGMRGITLVDEGCCLLPLDVVNPSHCTLFF